MLSVYLLQSLNSCYMILVPAVYNAIQAIHIQCLPFIYCIRLYLLTLEGTWVTTTQCFKIL